MCSTRLIFAQNVLLPVHFRVYVLLLLYATCIQYNIHEDVLMHITLQAGSSALGVIDPVLDVDVTLPQIPHGMTLSSSPPPPSAPQ